MRVYSGKFTNILVPFWTLLIRKSVNFFLRHPARRNVSSVEKRGTKEINKQKNKQAATLEDTSINNLFTTIYSTLKLMPKYVLYGKTSREYQVRYTYKERARGKNLYNAEHYLHIIWR